MAVEKTPKSEAQSEDEAQETSVEPAEAEGDTSDEVDAVDDAEIVEPEETSDAEDEAPSDDAPAEEASAQEEPETASSSSGFWPLLLGGVAAAGIGFVASMALEPQSGWFASGSSTNLAIEQLEIETASLRADFEAAQTRLADFQSTELAALQGLIVELQEQSDTRLSDLNDRLAELEARPLVEVAGSEDLEAAFAAELSELRARMEAQRAEMAAMADEASAKLEEAASKAAEVENSAITAANAAAVRAGLSRIQVAIDGGGPYAAPMGEVEQISETLAPDALVLQSEEGVATLAQLQQDFPLSARDTLAAVRSEAAPDQGVGGRLTAFFQAQTGARSVTPRDGDDADAVLSRAEAALQDGRLTDALAELDSLDDTAAAQMAAWRDRAETRLIVLAAFAEWADSLASN